MAFHNQLGRFGDLAQMLTGMADFDQRAANIISGNGNITGQRPTVSQALASKGFSDPNDAAWLVWLALFSGTRNAYLGSGGIVLQPNCPKSPPGFPPGYCLHELAPPLKHGSLRWFCQRIATVKDNLQTRADGSLGVDPSSKPVWNFIITAAGEIVTGSEDFEAIKHTCLAAGSDVWAAGQLGIDGGKVRLVDLQSGHYVRPTVTVGTNLATELIAFTENAFKQYCTHFKMSCLHPSFVCVWG
jgi:hypothetical protein